MVREAIRADCRLGNYFRGFSDKIIRSLLSIFTLDISRKLGKRIQEKRQLRRESNLHTHAEVIYLHACLSSRLQLASPARHERPHAHPVSNICS